MGDTPKTKTDEDKLIIGHQRSGAGKGVQLRRPRSNAFNAEKQDRFFNRLSETANVSEAARHAGAAVATVRHWRLTDALFRARWDQALADGYADLEMQMIGKALFGIESETVEAVDAKGRMVRRTRSDAPGLGPRLLEAHYARVAATHAAVQLAAGVPGPTSDATIAAMRARLLEMAAKQQTNDGAGGVGGDGVGGGAGGDGGG